MTCAPDVAMLVHNRAQSLDEFKKAFEGIRTYVLDRNQRVSFSKKLADVQWREQEIERVFQKMKGGCAFDELIDSPLLKKLVKTKGKNAEHIDYIRDNITPCYLKSIHAEPSPNLSQWITSLNAAFIDPYNLQHQRTILDKLPPEHRERLMKGKQTISMHVFKLATEGLFDQKDILAIVAHINNGFKLNHFAPGYFGVLAYEKGIKEHYTKEALILNLQGAGMNVHQLVSKACMDEIEAITKEFRDACSLYWLNAEIIPQIASRVASMAQPTKEQWIEYFAFQYLRLIYSNAPYQALFLESTCFGLTKLSEDPRIKKP